MVASNLDETAPKRKLCIACKQEFFGDEVSCPNDGTTLTPLTMENSIGSTIGDKYEILAVIGGGAMGLVYKARHTLMKRVVAVKMLHPNMLPDAGTIMRFKKEAEALSCLNHPNILTVFDFGISTQGQPYLVTDYLEGQTLGELLEQNPIVPWQRTVNIFMQVCSALAHAHKNGVIHRDIKPSNIMLTEFEDQIDVVKILDFGIAKVVSEENENSSQLTRTGEVFGSPLYMSPEQCRGKSLDARSDIYSLGCVMFRTLTGQPAFFGQDLVECLYKHVNEPAPSLNEVAPEANVPPELEAVVLKSLNKDPLARYQSMGELREALGTVAGVISTGLYPGQNTMTVPAVSQDVSSAALPIAGTATGAGAPLSQASIGALESTDPEPGKPPLAPLTAQTASPPHSMGTVDDTSAPGGALDTQPRSSSSIFQDKKALVALGVLLLLVIVVPLNLNKQGESNKSPTATATGTDVTTPEGPPKSADPFTNKLEEGIYEYELGDYDEAQDILNDAILIGQKEGASKDKIAEALHYMVNACIGAGEPTEAEAFVRQLEHEAKVDGKYGPPTSIMQAKAYQVRAAVLMTSNSDADDDQARKLLNAALKYFQTQKDVGTETMRALARLGLLDARDGNFASSQVHMKQAVSIAETDPSVRQLDVALRLDQLADAYVLLGGHARGNGSKYFTEAENLYYRAMQLRITNLKSRTHPALAQSFQRIGIMFFIRSDYNKALTEFDKALEIRKKQNKPLQIASVQRNIAFCYAEMGERAQADATFKDSIATAKQSDSDIALKIKEWQRDYDGLKSHIKKHR
ncbi:MAG: protein kinase [Candidatus Obscuribacterales bacterium]|nr:protein kinase [Candidatus Obscuribacterales bacterium]